MVRGVPEEIADPAVLLLRRHIWNVGGGLGRALPGQKGGWPGLKSWNRKPNRGITISRLRAGLFGFPSHSWRAGWGQSGGAGRERARERASLLAGKSAAPIPSPQKPGARTPCPGAARLPDLRSSWSRLSSRRLERSAMEVERKKRPRSCPPPACWTASPPPPLILAWAMPGRAGRVAAAGPRS